MGLKQSTNTQGENDSSKALLSGKHVNKAFSERKRKIKCKDLGMIKAKVVSPDSNDLKKKCLQSASAVAIPQSISSSSSPASTSCKLLTNFLSIKSLQQSERGSYLAAFFRLFGELFCRFYYLLPRST